MVLQSNKLELAEVADARHQERILANRETNLGIANKLRQYLDAAANLLLQDKLMIVEFKQVKTKSGTEMVRCERDLSPKDLRDLSGYAKDVMQMTYDALGDTPHSAKLAEGGIPHGGSGRPPAPAFIFQFPSILQKPRDPVAEAQRAEARDL